MCWGWLVLICCPVCLIDVFCCCRSDPHSGSVWSELRHAECYRRVVRTGRDQGQRGEWRLSPQQQCGHMEAIVLAVQYRAGHLSEMFLRLLWKCVREQERLYTEPSIPLSSRWSSSSALVEGALKLLLRVNSCKFAPPQPFAAYLTPMSRRKGHNLHSHWLKKNLTRGKYQHNSDCSKLIWRNSFHSIEIALLPMLVRNLDFHWLDYKWCGSDIKLHL